MPSNRLYRILLARDQQLHNQFLDLFTKYVVNSSHSVFFDHFKPNKLQIPYGQVYNFVKKHPEQQRSRTGGRSSSPQKSRNTNNYFSFQACNSSITLFLDLSPYMLNYDYESKSTPLMNLQMVVKDLLVRIRQKKDELLKMYKRMQSQHKEYNWNVQFNLTVYIFSVYQLTPITVLYRQDINCTSLALLTEFIINAIHKSNLPYQKKNSKFTIGDAIQKILDTEEPLLGIRSILVLSSYNQKQTNNKIFFTSNWYTYGFVNVGTNMGSYLIDEKQVLERYGSSSFFQIKYVFTCQFIENWQKVQKIQNFKNNFLTLKTQRHKTIMYISNAKLEKNIFDQLLQFKMRLRSRNSANSIQNFGGGESTSIKFLQFPKKQYRISQWNFSYILRTRYQQGWQPIVHQQKNQKVSKCVFRLDFNPHICVIYKAQLLTSNEGSFYFIQIGTKLNSQANLRKYKSSYQGMQGKYKEKLFDLIQNIDLICTSKYKLIHTNLLSQIGFKRKQYLSPFSLSQEFQTKSLRYVLNNPDEWGKFSKLKYFYFNFYPSLNKLLFEQFLSEISFFLGQKISDFIFMKKGWGKGENDYSKEHKIQFTQLIRKNNMMKIKIAYVNYSFKEINQIIEPFAYKFQSKKFKSGQAMIVSDQLFKFNDTNEISFQKMFQNKWKLKIQDALTFKSFTYYFRAVLKAEGFQQTGERRSPTVNSYAKRILINQLKQQSQAFQTKTQFQKHFNQLEKAVQKAIFCNMQFMPNNQIIFTFLMFPLIGKLSNFIEQSIYEQSLPSIPSHQIQSRQIKTPRNQIYAYDFFCRFTQNLRCMQIRIMKIVFTYNQIHETLLLRIRQGRINKNIGLGFSNQLKQLIKQLYPFRGSYFDGEYDILCQKVLSNYYSNQNDQKRKEIKEQSIDIDLIPQPRNYFIEADVPQIKGDLVIRKNDKQYIFFLLSPYHPIYICRKKNKFYYKSINMMYEDINIQEAQTHTLAVMINQISLIIQKEQYRKVYSQFFYTPQTFSKKLQELRESVKRNQKNLQIQGFINKIQKFNPPSETCLQILEAISLFGIKTEDKQPQSAKQLGRTQQATSSSQQIDERISPLVKQFVKIYFRIVNAFFDRQMGEYYFQRECPLQGQKLQRYCLADSKMENFNQLILKNYLKLSGQQIPVTEENLSTILFQYKNQLSLNKAKIVFLCYSQLHEQSSRANSSFLYFLGTLNKLCIQFVTELQRVRISRASDLQKLRKHQASKFFNQTQTILPQRFYDKLTNQKISSYIQSASIQRLIPLKKIPSQIYQYIAVEVKQVKNSKQVLVPYIPFWLMLEIVDSKVQIQYYQCQFFSKAQEMHQKVRQYIQELVNYINCDILIFQMNNTKQLPLEPHQLFVSDLANHPNNKLVQTRKKNNPKKGLKGIRGRMENQKKQNLKVNSQGAVSMSKTNPVPLIAKKYILLNQRFKVGEGIQAIKKYQNLPNFQITNLKSTYLFPTLYDQNSRGVQKVIFHFQQEDFEKIYKQIPQEEIFKFDGKPKRVLIYFVHGLNDAILKSKYYEQICKTFKDAIQLKIFQTLSHQLFISPQNIQPKQERQIKKGQSRSFSFQIPFVPFVDDFKGYLKQHISMYHTKTQFKSQKKFASKKPTNEEEAKAERSQSLLSKNGPVIQQFEEGKNQSFKQSFSQQLQITHISVSHSQSLGHVCKDSPSSFNVFQDKKKGASFGGKQNTNQAECQFCIPTMWLFNYKKNTKLESKFGKCLYLLKIDIHHNVSVAQNVRIWQKFIGNKKKKLYIGCNLNQNRKILLKQYLCGTKPSASKADPQQSELKTIITFHIIHWLGNPMQTTMEKVFNSIIRTSISDYYIENCINYNKLKYVVSPLDSILLPKLEEKPSFMKQSISLELSIDDLSLQKTKSQNILNISQQNVKTQNENQTDFLRKSDNNHFQREKFLKKTEKKQLNEEKMFKQILDHSQSINKIIQQSSNQSLFKVICNQQVLIKNPILYIKDFYKYLNQVFQGFSCRNLLFIYYIQFKNNIKQTIYFIDDIQTGLQLNHCDKVKILGQKLEKMCPQSNLNQIKRIGFICNDLFYQYIQTSRVRAGSNLVNVGQNSLICKLKDINLQSVERCKIFTQDKSFCLADYYFTRSIYINYQISYQGFKYYSYNVNIFLNSKISQFLTPLHAWVQQKYRLLKFIRGIKQRQVYEVIPLSSKKNSQNKFGFIFQLYLQTLKSGKKEQECKKKKAEQRDSLSPTRILIALVFYDYPINFQDGSLINLSSQIKRIFDLLKSNPVNYKQMPQYKGKQKFLLQKLGRQYISLLKSTYGFKLNNQMPRQSMQKLKYSITFQ